MTPSLIKGLFASDIYRRIEEVIKVDQTDEEILCDEIDEYVATNPIRSRYTSIFEAYSEAPNKPTDGIAIWISGFYGSGKSSFAKMLGLSISNRTIGGEPAAERFARRVSDKKIEVLLKIITEKIPTHAVIFDVSTDRGIRSGSQRLTEIMYALFLQSLGYSKDLDLSELEIELENAGRLGDFEAEYRRIFSKEWFKEKSKVVFALNEASRVLNSLDPVTYPVADSWVKAAKGRVDVSPGKLAQRVNELMQRRLPGHSLLFVVDEVGQFVARDIQKMEDLRAIVENLGIRGRGKHWVAVTSQEKLDELVSGLDDTKIELARLMDRFPLQVHLEPSDISEVTSRRVLSKNANAQLELGVLFDEHRGKLTQNTRVTADIKLPELTRDGFVDLYPLLPYQVDLIIQVVSGLRTRGGSGKHVGGANRTIIKLAQQLLVNPIADLANQPIGTLARIDHVYDLVEGNIASEIRAKIAAIPKEVDHPLAQSVAKAICLLQYVQSVHCTAENIAATLHPMVAAESQIDFVKAAIQVLEGAHKIRSGDRGYRIPTPAEDDWERIRNGVNPKPADIHRIYSDLLREFWQPQPSHSLLGAKTFKAGLAMKSRELVQGDIVCDITIADSGEDFEALAATLRGKSQVEKKTIFWAASPSDAIDREMVQYFRSEQIVSDKERGARTADELSLIAEERVRKRKHQDKLRRLLKVACLTGSAYFRGKDRSPGPRANDVGKTAAEIMGQALPEVFDRFGEAAAPVNDVKKGIDALFTAENLRGLPSVFGDLKLLQDEQGKAVFRIQSGPLAEVLGRIEERASYGETSNGRYLAESLSKEPFGWEFDVVRLFVLCLLRAGKIDATSRSQTLESAVSVEARETFSNNNLFRQASFRPKKGLEFTELVKAAEAFRETFGKEVSDLSDPKRIAEDIKTALQQHEDEVAAALALLLGDGLPGTSFLEASLSEVKAILRGSESNVIATFNASHRQIMDAIKRSAELGHALSESAVYLLRRSRRLLNSEWVFLAQEPDVPENVRAASIKLEDILARETFYRDLPSTEEYTRLIGDEYESRYRAALQKRAVVYTDAIDRLSKAPGWDSLTADVQERLVLPLRMFARVDLEGVPIPQLRSDVLACDARLRDVIKEMRRMIDGERIVSINFNRYFDGGVETVEQLDAALEGIREECAHLIGKGKKIVLD